MGLMPVMGYERDGLGGDCIQDVHLVVWVLSVEGACRMARSSVDVTRNRYGVGCLEKFTKSWAQHLKPVT
jgi:hypothetical protein